MYNLDSLKQELKNAEEWLSKEYSQIHTGRANPALLDGVVVETYGNLGPLKNSASISIEDPKTIRVVPWDKSLNKIIEKALHEANLGFSISVDDAGVRVIIPALTTETRQKLVKIAKDKMEDARITVRKARENELSSLKNQSLPEDTFIRAKEEVQKFVDTTNTNLEAIFAKKETEILN
jgi:ribosome recycling factor